MPPITPTNSMDPPPPGDPYPEDGLRAAADIAGRPLAQLEKLGGVTLPRAEPTTAARTRF